ncbi:MAG: hypothetical protein IT342_05835 [Candidatus Melainabacteria bacterium]|nr:hypothetical protein [Candidatus Melainabacteria bacterium]
MIRFRDRSASSSRILAAISCGVFIASPVFAQQGLSDWQSSTSPSAPDPNWSSTPPGSYLSAGKAPAKKTNTSSKASSAPPLRTDDFSSDFSSKGQGLSGWQTGTSDGGSGISGGSQGLSGWQTGTSGGGSSTSGGSQGLSGWQTGTSGGGSGTSGGSQGLSGWQTSGSGGGSNATLGDVLQQEQNMGGNNTSTQLQGGVERDRTVNNGGGIGDMNGGGLNNPMGGGMGGPLNGGMNGGLNGMGGNPMGGMGGLGGLGGALGGMGGAGGLMEVLMNIMPKRPTPGAAAPGGGVNQSFFRTKSHSPNVLTGVPKTINRSVNKALNRNINRGISIGAARATNMAIRKIRF